MAGFFQFPQECGVAPALFFRGTVLFSDSVSWLESAR